MGDADRDPARRTRSCSSTRPEAILAHPADAFVETFVGNDRALKRLGLLTVGRFAVAGQPPAGAPVVAVDSDLRDALSALLAADVDMAAVIDGAGANRGVITLRAIRAALAEPPAHVRQ